MAANRSLDFPGKVEGRALGPLRAKGCDQSGSSYNFRSPLQQKEQMQQFHLLHLFQTSEKERGESRLRFTAKGFALRRL